VLDGLTVNIFGDGAQVRDVLHVDDLVAAMLLARDRADGVVGRAFNIGGGPARSVSLLEVLAMLRDLQGGPFPVEHGPVRAGEQYYVADTTAFNRATGWSPDIGVREGVGRLWRWLVAQGAAVRSPDRAGS
jgi:CDP-paratose 2-epimerase